MAIHLTSRLNPPLPPMADGVEFYVTECKNVNAPFSTQFGDLTQPFRACTVLVSFAKSDAERAALWPLRHALAFGQTSSSVCDGAEWLQKLPKRLLERLKSTGHDLCRSDLRWLRRPFRRGNRPSRRRLAATVLWRQSWCAFGRRRHQFAPVVTGYRRIGICSRSERH